MTGRAALILAVLAATGCGATEYRYVSPWFRIARSPRHSIAPHAIEWGGVERPEVLVDERWRGLAHGQFRTTPVGSGVAVEEFTAAAGGHPVDDRRWGATGVFIYHAGSDAPAHIPARQCRTPYVTAREVTCFACGEKPPYGPIESVSGSCRTIRLSRFDEYGRFVDERAVQSPIAQPEIEGQLASGDSIFAETKPNLDFLFLYGPRVRFRLDAQGLARLPYGADPLTRELGAEERGRSILEEVPIRDAAVASLRAQLDEDEGTRPDWSVQKEIVNALSAGQALEVDLPKVTPGACYLVIARTTPEPTLTLSVQPYGEASLDPFAPPVARVDGSSGLTIERCVAPGDPPNLRVRIAVGAGRAYVVARAYRRVPR